MSSTDATPDSSQETKLRPWQFGLRELLIAVLALSVLCAVASWSIFSAIFLLTLAATVGAAIACLGKHRGKISRKVATALATAPVLLLVVLLSLMKGYRGEYAGNVTIQVLDARDQSPIANASVNLLPNADPFSGEVKLTDKTGMVSLTGTFDATSHTGGWGRASYTLYFARTEVWAEALGYESRTVRWEEISSEFYRSADAPQGEPMVIELRPIPETARH
jgi:hypothetical protein